MSTTARSHWQASGSELRGQAILFIHSSDEAYGSDRVLVSLVDIARSSGMDVRVLLPDDQPDGWVTHQLNDRNVTVDKGPLAPARRRYLRPRALLNYAADVVRAVRFVSREVERTRPRVIHVNTSTVTGAVMIRRKPGRRVIWHVQELHVSPRMLAWLYRNIPLWRADDVVAISDAVADNLRKGRFRRTRVHRIYSVLAPAAPSSRPLPNEDVRCAFVGRLLPWKGYELFVRAAAKVAHDFRDAGFVLAGTPPTGQEWRSEAVARLVADLGLSHRFELVGLCEDVPELLRSVDVVVVPSVQPEPFGLVTVEAMQAGCAVIASDHGGSPELIENGVSGLLVTPGSVEAIAGALGQLLADPPLRQRLAAEGRRRTERRFQPASFSAEITALWTSALGGTAAGGGRVGR